MLEFVELNKKSKNFELEEREGHYIVGVRCHNCGEAIGNVYIPIGIVKNVYLSGEDCEYCGCPIV